MDLNKIRSTIDQIDSKILKLLNDRMEQALLAKRFKNSIEDLERENAIMEKIKTSPNLLLEPEFKESIYGLIISWSKKLQARDYKVIGFQGEHGAYSEDAACKWDNDLLAIPCTTFNEVFERVNSGLFDFGIVPVENTRAGIVESVYELLINTEVFIAGAIDIPICHNLLAPPGTDHREIKEVYSHSQALSQCRSFLARNKLTPVPFYDTAGSARMLAEAKPRGAACISGKLAAELYNLEVIKDNIQDFKNNRTRFLVLSKENSECQGTKCSVTFSVQHKSGALFSVLKIFADAGINLTRIESIPTEPGSYSFFIDFEGSNNDPAVQEVLNDVAEATTDFRLLGCYIEKFIINQNFSEVE
ncbi:MAG: prephenate dehydratase [Spirochaetes bacterium]|nr:prephenate dehydratase [Spirochaetota bacterium]